MDIGGNSPENTSILSHGKGLGRKGDGQAFVPVGQVPGEESRRGRCCQSPDWVRYKWLSASCPWLGRTLPGGTRQRQSSWNQDSDLGSGVVQDQTWNLGKNMEHLPQT